MSKTLICLTASFPHGMRETYFESELQYLAAGFDEVIIVPKYNPYKVDSIRNIPSNVKIVSPALPMNKLKRLVKGLLSAAPIKFYLSDFFENKVYCSYSRFNSWFRSLVMHRIVYRKFEQLLQDQENDVVIYSYWADAPILATRLLDKYKKVVRMHRWDFYIEEHDGYLPVRKNIYLSSDLLLPISVDIQERLIKDYKVVDDKIHLSYLGVSSVTEGNELFSSDNDGVLRIVSCSRVDPIKRVELIADAIFMISDAHEVEWHHFGDGIHFEELKRRIRESPKHISINLHGWTEQKDLYEFYKKNYVTWFINVSRHEGVPVSIMEAISFGIPSIATNVGATRELVDDQNGYLVSENIIKHDLAELILTYRHPEYAKKRIAAYQTWKTRFDADKNYKVLVDRLLNINRENGRGK